MTSFAVLCGGVGAARFLLGAQQVCAPGNLTAVVNCGDDTVLHGLHISPDIDTIIYTLSDQINPETGWGLRDETWQAMGRLTELGGEAWFNLGDKDLATHMFRTQKLHQGDSLTDITAQLAQAHGVGITVLPMSNDRVETRLVLADDGLAGAELADPPTPDSGGTPHEVGFQEYFVKLRHDVAVRSVRFAGADAAQPALEALAAMESAEVVVIAPSNPVVSIGPLLALGEIRQVLARRFSQGRPVAAISPLIGGRALKGPADRLMSELGSQPSSVGVARWYEGLIHTLVIDTADSHEAQAVEELGIRCVVTPTDMSQPGVSAQLAKLAFGIA